MTHTGEGMNNCLGALVNYFINFQRHKSNSTISDGNIELTFEERREHKKMMIINNLSGECCICLTKLHNSGIPNAKLYYILKNSKYIKKLKNKHELCVLNCGHVYHTVCINKWHEYSSKCPYCKCSF
jgi:hypothetical protein